MQMRADANWTKRPGALHETMPFTPGKLAGRFTTSNLLWPQQKLHL